MTPPLKPTVCIVGDRLAVFIDADYKLLPLSVADEWIRMLQSALSRLRREEKRRKRAAREESL